MGFKVTKIRKDGGCYIMSMTNVVIDLLDSKDLLTEEMKPDSFDNSKGQIPPSKFVICRDINGEVTARYSDEVWDMSPWSFFEDKKGVYFKFRDIRTVAKGTSSFEDRIVDEIRFLCFALLYMVNKGVTGTYSLGTIQRKWFALKRIANFCINYNKQSDLSFEIYPIDILSNQHKLALYLREVEHTESQLKEIRNVLHGFSVMGEELIGFSVASANVDDTTDYNRTPLIPKRIYFSFYKALMDEVAHIHSHKDKIEALLNEFQDPLFGYAHATQKGMLHGIKEKKFSLTLAEGLQKHNLEVFFSDSGKYGASSMKDFRKSLALIQQIIIVSVLFFTGMRNQECRGMKYHCLEYVNIPVWKKGKKIDSGKTVPVVSRTTKYDGYKREASWFAPIQVIQSIQVAQAICRPVAKRNDLDLEECHLFIDVTTSLTGEKIKSSVASASNAGRNKGFWGDSYVITKDDYNDLLLSDDERDWASQKEFQVGQPWRFKHHQFRRSLAFYMSNTGLVSMPSIKRQFKHHSLLVTRHYAKNFHNMKSILGVQSNATSNHKVPKWHVAYDFQTGLTLSEAEKIIQTFLGADKKLFGKMGSYIERNRVDVTDGNEVVIAEKRKETIKRVKAGEVKLTETLLGGCTSTERCDKYALGDMTGCIGCDGAAIEEDKLVAEVKKLEDELSQYEPSSIEYKITVIEHSKLTDFRKKHFQTEEQRYG